MQLGMIGLGRMGANMVRRLLAGGHRCVVFNMVAESGRGVDPGKRRRGFVDRGSREEAGDAARHLVDGPRSGRGRDDRRPPPHLTSGDILIDGGNSYYVDDIRRAQELAAKGIHYVDVGTSGGVWGRERGTA